MFCEIGNYAVNSHLSFARNLLLTEKLDYEVRFIAKSVYVSKQLMKSDKERQNEINRY